jgi:sterol desaturase/sphingolipid hydroxylase (fatty acid hydroxylase superfamily)
MLMSVSENAQPVIASLWHGLIANLALDARQLIFVIATPFFIGTTLWEYRRIRHDPRLMNAHEALQNFMLGAGYQITELLFAGIISFPVFALAWHYRVATLAPTALSFALTFVAVDFAFYWAHRASHRMRWFWAAHVVHHSSQRMNFSTAMRQNATNIFNGGWLFYVPLALIGFNPVWLGICYALSLVYQFFIHTTLVHRLPAPIEFVFNTPSHHRVHHGKNPGYIDRNYGGVLILWDRLFGSFVDEDEKGEIEYGITRPVPGNSLWVYWTHEYRDLFADMARPGSLLQRLKHLWMPPEWERSPGNASGVTRETAAAK